MGFWASVGLAVTLEEMRVREIGPERIMDVARAACAPVETIDNSPFAVTPEDVCPAILAADAIGRHFLSRNFILIPGAKITGSQGILFPRGYG